MIKIVKDLCRIEYGASPKQIRSDDNTGICIYGTGGFVGYSKEPLFKEPLIVVARKGTLDKPLLADLPCWVIDTAYAAIPKNDVDVKWLYYQFQMFDLSRLNESTGVPSISRSYLYKQPIPYQAQPEQRKIATILSTVDKVIENTEAAIEKYKAIKAGMMKDLFNRGIDVKTGKLRPSFQEAHELYKETELGWIPKDWEVCAIKEACLEFINGGTPSTKNTTNWIGTIPWITGADFLDTFEVGIIRRHINEEALRCSSSHLIKMGNILLVTRTGVGKLAIAPFDVAISQDITGIILDSSKYEVGFFYYYLQILVDDFKKMNQGTSINGIIRSDLEAKMIARPSVNEQRQIMKILKTLDTTLRSESNDLYKYQDLKKGLMSDLLTGKVRVKTNEDKRENE